MTAPDTSTVLVVDDEPPLLRLIARVLERQGHTVLVAHDGSEAISLFEKHRDEIAVAVLDVVIPPNGVGEVIDHIASRGKDVAIVLSSGDVPGAEISKRISDLHAAFLRKPFLPKDLIELVAQGISKQSTSGSDGSGPSSL